MPCFIDSVVSLKTPDVSFQLGNGGMDDPPSPDPVLNRPDPVSFKIDDEDVANGTIGKVKVRSQKSNVVTQLKQPWSH